MTSETLHAFTDWLSRTPVSLVIQNVTWIVPAVQVVHITFVSVIMGAAVLLDFRLLNVAGRGQPISVLANRLLPWMWWAIPILLCTGSILIIGEPARSLENPIFQLKMSLLILAVCLTLGTQRGLRSDSAFWDIKPSRRLASKLIALASMALWVSIVFAGRWIAYFDANA